MSYGSVNRHLHQQLLLSKGWKGKAVHGINRGRPNLGFEVVHTSRQSYRSHVWQGLERDTGDVISLLMSLPES